MLASGSLQYAEDWRAQLADLAAVCSGYLYVTRLPYARASPSFHMLQRAYRYGYETEYVGWVVSRAELLELRRRARARAGARARPRRLALGRGRAGGSDRPPRVPVQGRRRLRGSRSLIRPSKSHVSSSAGSVGGEPGVLVRARARRGATEGEAGAGKTGLRPPPGRPGPESAVGGLDRAADRRVTLGVRVERRRDQSGAGSAPATRWATASEILLDQRLLLGGERRRRPLVGASADRDAEPALVDARPNLDLELERDDTDLGHQKRNSSRKSNERR